MSIRLPHEYLFGHTASRRIGESKWKADVDLLRKDVISAEAWPMGTRVSLPQSDTNTLANPSHGMAKARENPPSWPSSECVQTEPRVSRGKAVKRFISRYKKALIEKWPVIQFQSRLPARPLPGLHPLGKRLDVVLSQVLGVSSRHRGRR